MLAGFFAGVFGIGVPASADISSIEAVRVGSGIACRVDGNTGPPSYAVSQLGMPDVPRLTDSESGIVRKIAMYLHSPNLRFVKDSSALLFVVFNARPNELCDERRPPFIDLNGACNAYYSPVERPYTPTAAMGCYEPPRPWIPGDRGTGTGTWQQVLGGQ